MSPGFHADIVSSALAKFLAEDDEASAHELVDGCDDEETRALAVECGHLAVTAADMVATDVKEFVAFSSGVPTIGDR